MAKREQSHIVRKYHSVVRSELGLVVPPILAIAAAIAALVVFGPELTREDGTSRVEMWWYAVPLAFLIFPLWAKFKTRFFQTYTVTLDSVIEQHGLLSRTTSEIRIQDIRNVVVSQSFFDRIMGMGTVHFSSAAGSGVEVTFANVGRPKRIKELVRDIQEKLRDGELSPAEIEQISAKASGKARAALPAPAEEPKAEPATEQPALPAPTPVSAAKVAQPAKDDDAAQDELYRLLAEQEADGLSEKS